MDYGHASYSVYICDPFGVRLADASKFVSLSYARVVNNWSTMTLTLPNTFDQTMLRVPDGRVEIWRRATPNAPEVLDTEAIWLIKAVQQERDEHGNQNVTIEADTPLCLLKMPGRFIAFASGSANAQTATFADDAIKAIARNNVGSGAALSRDLSAYLTIAPNLSAAPAITKQFALRDCLKVMQELAASSTQAGTYLAFDIVAPTPATLEFRTYTGWRGVDHRFPGGINPVIIGPEFGSVGACKLREDYRAEITYALAAGQGQGSDRLSGASQDSARIGASPFGLREVFVNAPQYSTVAGLAAEADAVVRGGRPRATFQGTLLSVPGCQYGVHWGWGDFVTIQAFQQSFDCRIDAITVQVQGGKETIKAVLRNDQ